MGHIGLEILELLNRRLGSLLGKHLRGMERTKTTLEPLGLGKSRIPAFLWVNHCKSQLFFLSFSSRPSSLPSIFPLSLFILPPSFAPFVLSRLFLAASVIAPKDKQWENGCIHCVICIQLTRNVLIFKMGVNT